MVAAVRRDPAQRLGLAGRFYDDRAGRVPIRAYRRCYRRSLAARRTHARMALRSPSSRRCATTPNAMIAQPAAGTARATAASL